MSDTLTPADAALLDKPSLVQNRCCVCGDPTQSNHHAAFKSQVPKADHHRIPVLSVCGVGNESGCHRLVQARWVVPYYESMWGWCFRVTDEAARQEVDSRRTANGYDPIQGDEFGAIYSGKGDITDTEPDELTYELWTTIERIDQHEAHEAWQKAIALIAIRTALIERFGKRNGLSAFREQYQERGYTASRVSRLTEWADTLGGCVGAAALGPSRGYVAARAVKDGVLLPAEAVAEAEALSVSDFRAAYLGATEREPVIYHCPKCGTEGVAADFKGESCVLDIRS